MQINHNTKVITCELPEGTVMHVPTGYHVYLQMEVDGMFYYINGNILLRSKSCMGVLIMCMEISEVGEMDVAESR